MAVTFVAAGSQASGTGAITAGLPSGIQTDDLLLLVVESANETITVNTSGWTQLASSPQGTGTAAGTAATRLAVYWRWVDGTEANTSIADSGNHTIATIAAYRGVDTTSPLNAQAGTVNASASTTCTFPSITTTVDNCLVLLINARALPDSNTNTQTTNHTNANLTGIVTDVQYNTSAGNGGGFCVASGLKASAGSVGSSTATNSTSTVTGVVTLALAPAPEAQALTPVRYDNSQTFYGPTVTVGSVTLTATRYDNSQTFYAATVELGTTNVDLFPSLHTNENTIFSPVVSAGQIVLAPARYDNSSTFYAPTVATTYQLTPALYSNDNTFYSVVATDLGINVFPELVSNSNTFYAATVSKSADFLLPGLLINTNAFYTHTLTAPQTLSFDEYVDSGYVDTGYVEFPYFNTNTFFAATVRQPIPYVLKYWTGTEWQVIEKAPAIL